MNANIITAISEGSNASNPPDFESSACLFVILDRFFFLTMRCCVGEDSIKDVAVWLLLHIISLDHDACRSRFLLLRRNCVDGEDIEDTVGVKGVHVCVHGSFFVELLLLGELSISSVSGRGEEAALFATTTPSPSVLHLLVVV